MADHSNRIAEIQRILRAGAKSVSGDGTSVSYDFDELRLELRKLMADDDAYKGRRRPVVATIKLGG